MPPSLTRVQEGVEAGRHADRFEHADAGVVDAAIRAGAARRADVERHDAADEIDEVIGEASTDPAVGIGETAVECPRNPRRETDRVIAPPEPAREKLVSNGSAVSEQLEAWRPPSTP